MNKLADVNNYHDLSGLQKIKAQSSGDPQSAESKEALKKAAQHFESIFIGMMLKSMRDANAAFEQDNPMNSNTTKFFRDMYDDQLATDMAMNGTMGLADIIVEQLGGGSEGFKAASILRNDSGLTRQDFGIGSGDSLLDKADQNALHQALSGNNEFASRSNTPQSLTQPSLSQSASNQPLIMQPSELPERSVLSSFNQSIDKAFSAIGAEKPTGDELNQPIKAPVNFESPKDFINSMWQYAKKAASKIGVSPSVIVAQSALETGWGKHIIKDKNGDSSFNLFNVKAHRDWDGEKAAQSTLEFEQGVAVRKVEPFRVYNNFTEAFDDFVGFLKSNSRYKPALESAQDSEQFLHNLQKAGYATDPKYAEKIISILNSDNFKGVVQDLTKVDDNDIGA